VDRKNKATFAIKPPKKGALTCTAATETGDVSNTVRVKARKRK
jgi:hypothetical protein